MFARSLLLFILTAMPLYASPVVIIHDANYKIVGDTAQALRQQMSALGPSDITTEHFDASTRWFIQWQYQYQEVAKECHLTKVEVKVDITYRLPEWAGYTASSDKALKLHWANYIQHLKTHEKGHAENGIEAAKQIEQTLKQLPAMESCELLANTADDVAYQVIAEHNTKDIRYEEATQHGAMQGATFP